MKLTQKIAFLCISTMLFTSFKSDDLLKTEETKIDSSTLKTYTNITFSLDQSEGFDAGRYFSTELGKSFKKSQIDVAILPKIDIAFYSGGFSLDYFMSPNDSDYGIKNATTSQFINVQKDLTIGQFNKIEQASDFNTIKIDADDDDSFPDNKTPNVVLFKNAAGKKGAIYVKSVTRVGSNPRIVVDIKIQK
jgi:hypothetical protein